MQPVTGAVTAPAAAGGLTTTLDIAALVSAILWPLVLLVVLLVYREQLAAAVKWLGPQVKSFSIGWFSLELAEARPLGLQMAGAVDLRHDGQSGDINDSTLRSFYTQIEDPSRLDYAVVDLGDGHEWLTSRLFILSIILARMRGLSALVFVETAAQVRRKFVGVADCGAVRWRLARRFPWLEAALAHAESAVWQNPLAVPGGAEPIIENDQGRLVWPGGSSEPAAQLLRAFLDGIQQPLPVPPTDEWETLPSSNPPRIERARWLTAADLEHIMGPALNPSSVGQSELAVQADAGKARLLLAQTGRWVALTRDERIFERLVDRAQVIETLARTCVQSAEGAP